MPNNIEQVINIFSEKIKNILGERVKKIILYGSYARGDFNNHSDVDIMILTDCNDEEIEYYRDLISDVAFDIELEKGIVISPIIKNITKYNTRVNFVPFYANVQKEGVILNGWRNRRGLCKV